MPNRSRLVFFGTDEFSLPSLETLIGHKYEIVAVVTKPDARTGRSHELVAPPVKVLALRHSIRVFQPRSLVEITEALAALEPLAGVVVSYGKLIPAAVIELFPQGLINVHASLLPKYRGASPIEAAILNGDRQTGVTLMRIDEGLDTGPTYTHADVLLNGTETRPALSATLATVGAELLARDLPHILNGTLKADPQTDHAATTVGLIRKAEGTIEWSMPSEAIERQVRAYLGWPGSRTAINGVEVTITGLRLLEGLSGTPGTARRGDGGELVIYTGNGAVEVLTLKPAGKREMTGREFLAGHPL